MAFWVHAKGGLLNSALWTWRLRVQHRAAGIRRKFDRWILRKAIRIGRRIGGREWFAGEVANVTGFPWWNGKAYDSYHGLSARIRQADVAIGSAVDDLSDVIDWLRADGQYDKADRVRAIAGRLARAQDRQPEDKSQLIRDMARGWK